MDVLPDLADDRPVQAAHMGPMSNPAYPCQQPAVGPEMQPTLSASEERSRRIGVEIEFMGLSARAAARVLADRLGGVMVEEDPHAFLVQGSSLGDLAVQLDIRYVHPKAHGKSLPIHLGTSSAAWLGSALTYLVPRELIVSPVAVDRLVEVDQAVDVLRRAGATGRGASWFGSLGLHFNIDPPRLDVRTLVGVFKAFLLIEPWLRSWTVRRGWTRRAAFLPASFPPRYVRQVLAPDYWPDLATFTDGYLHANPTRNRALDLLPILQHFDEARVRAKLPYEKIGSRPALHYRLPRAHVGEPGWSIAPDWDRWMAVERLAGEPHRLDALGLAYRRFHGTDEAWMQIAGLHDLAGR
jgi:hypothetical protein